jgi:hypothetical protein
MLRCLPGRGLQDTSDRVVPTVPVRNFFLEYGFAAAARRETNGFDVRIHHDSDKIVETDAGLPAELAAGLGGIGNEDIDFEGTEMAPRDFHVLVPIEARIGESFLEKLPNGMGVASADDVVVGAVLLNDLPDGFDVFGSVAPIAARFEVAEVESVGFAGEDGSDATSDLAGDESFATARTFMIEVNPAGSVQAIALAVDTGHPVGIELSGGVGTARLKGSELALRGRSGAEDFGAGGLIEARLAAAAADGFEKAGGAKSRDVAGVFGNIEADAHVALRGEVVEFVRGKCVDEAENPFGARQVAMMEEEAGARLVGVLIDVIDALGVESARAADDAVDFIAFGKEELGEIGAVLSGDAGDEGAFHRIEFRLLVPTESSECYSSIGWRRWWSRMISTSG